MRVFARGRWLDGFLDYTPGVGDVTIGVRRWLTLGQVSGLYFVRPHSFRMVYQYLRELGSQEVIRKIRSRQAEKLRNRKFLSVGLGVTLDGERRRTCVFIATMHPEGVDRLCLPACAVRILDEAPPSDLRLASHSGQVSADLAQLAGWSPHAGKKLPDTRWARGLDAAIDLIRRTAWEGTLLAAAAPPPSLSRPAREGQGILYGYGNYAKLYIVPNVSKALRIDRICDIDPVQLPRNPPSPPEWGTEAGPRPEDAYKAYFIAGYHHSHAEIAVAGLERDAAVVVEKPVAVDQGQLDGLLSALDRGSGRLFAGYHKRYSPLTRLALADLTAARGAPVDYHCTVYEVPLPERHWYRWPNSHTRIVSNGCHWLDHFLFMNEYSAVSETDVTMSKTGAICCAVELKNGAFFTMTLTENGSERLGMRDHVEMRHEGRTVTIIDNSRYTAEERHGVLRRCRVNKVRSYVAMYREISRRIVAGEPGDSRRSISVGGQLIIDVELQLARRYGPAAVQNERD